MFTKNKSVRLDDISPEYIVRDVCGATLKRETPNSKGEIEIRCPVHTDKYVEVNLAKGGTWNCFRSCSDCPAGCKGGKLDLVRLFYNISDRKEAFKRVIETLGVESNQKLAEKRKANDMKPKEIVENSSPEELNRTYTAFLNMLTLSKAHKADLEKRGLSDEDIKAMGFKSVPQIGINSIAKKLEEEGYTIKGVPGFYYDKQRPCMENLYCSGYFIPYRDEENRIIALQIRKDISLEDAKDEEKLKELKKRRYRWFTSSYEDNGAAATNVPFYGIPGYEHKDVCYATEGGLKASVAQSLSKGWFVAIPGVTCYSTWRTILEYLKKEGVTTLVDAFDSDRATNPSVAASIEKIHEIAKEYGFDMKYWDWGTEEKGVDDYLLARHKAKKKKKKQQ